MLDANLGTIGVWLAFLACIAGIVVSIVGLVTHYRLAAGARVRLARAGGSDGNRRQAAGTGPHCRRAPRHRRHGACPCHARLLAGVRSPEQQHRDAAAVLHHRDVVRARWVDPSVGPRARGRVGHLRVALPDPGGRCGDPLRHPRPLRGVGLLLRPDGRARQPLRDRPGSDAGARAQLAPPGQPARGDPPATPLYRIRPLHRAVRLCHRHAGDGPGGRSLADRVPALDVGGLHLPLRRHRARCMVVVPGARLGRILGVGPGGERRVAAVALRDGLPPLDARPGAARPHAGLEPLPVDRDLRADHPRHLPDPVRGDQLGPRLLRVGPRAVAHRVLLRRGHPGLRAHRLARRPLALSGWHRRPARTGGCVPAQQRALRRLRLRRAARDLVPAPLPGGDSAAGQCGRAVLQHRGHSGRPDAAVPHGRGTGAQLAQDQRLRAVAAPGDSGVDRCGHRRALRRLRPARRGHAGRLRTGRHGGGHRGTRPRPVRAGRPRRGTSACGAASWAEPTAA